jgi:hypothetical protein
MYATLLPTLHLFIAAVLELIDQLVYIKNSICIFETEENRCVTHGCSFYVLFGTQEFHNLQELVHFCRKNRGNKKTSSNPKEALSMRLDFFSTFDNNILK